MKERLNPTHIIQIVTIFWASKALLTEVEAGFFTLLGNKSITAQQLRINKESRWVY